MRYSFTVRGRTHWLTLSGHDYYALCTRGSVTTTVALLTPGGKPYRYASVRVRAEPRDAEFVCFVPSPNR
jgi:hypothetical protein